MAFNKFDEVSSGSDVGRGVRTTLPRGSSSDPLGGVNSREVDCFVVTLKKKVWLRLPKDI